jgi:hypothetical protein
LAQPIVAARESSFKHANLKKYQKQCQWALIPRYPSHISSNTVWVEVLQLEPILKENSADEPPGGDGEAALVEGHERDHKPLGWPWHGLISGNSPLHGGGERRKLARLDEMHPLLAGHIGVHPV